MIRTDIAGKLQSKYLPSNAKVIVFSETSYPLAKYGDKIYIRESYNNQINTITSDGSTTEVAYDFDFGDYNIPAEFFTRNDPFKAAELLLSSDFASINRFMSSKSKDIVCVTFQITSQNALYNTIGINRDNTWSWITTSPEEENSLLHSSIRCITDNDELVILLTSDRLPELKKYYKELNEKSFTNNSNYISIIRLKIK
ncbi:MAG: 6-bladed beta-propeller [Rikenellaceae bacterium]